LNTLYFEAPSGMQIVNSSYNNFDYSYGILVNSSGVYQLLSGSKGNYASVALIFSQNYTVNENQLIDTVANDTP
jgi:hypothetical protein